MSTSHQPSPSFTSPQSYQTGRQHHHQRLLRYVPRNQNRGRYQYILSPRNRNNGRPNIDRSTKLRHSRSKRQQLQKSVKGIGNTTWHATRSTLIAPLVGNVKVNTVQFDDQYAITKVSKHHPLALRWLTAVMGWHKNRDKEVNVLHDCKECAGIKNSV